MGVAAGRRPFRVRARTRRASRDVMCRRRTGRARLPAVHAVTTPASATIEPDGRPWWRSTWPLHRREWCRLAIALVVVVGVGAIVGLVLTDWLAPNAVTRLDLDVARRLARGRTPTGNDLAQWGASVSETPVKIAATLVIALVMLRRWRRWYEPLFITLPLVFEASAFMAMTLIVRRPRPAVHHLLGSPVASSFPSGHVAAATVYLAIAIVVFRHTRSLAVRVVVTIAAVGAPVVVAWARMYQGMHNLSDVVAGVVLGLVSIVICARILGPPPPTGAARAVAPEH